MGEIKCRLKGMAGHPSRSECRQGSIVSTDPVGARLPTADSRSSDPMTRSARSRSRSPARVRGIRSRLGAGSTCVALMIAVLGIPRSDAAQDAAA